MKRYEVRFERDESGAWLARVPAIRGCHTYGRTLEQARRRIREALCLWVEDVDEAELIEQVQLPAPLRQALRRSESARARAESERRNAQDVTAASALELVREHGLSLRDAGELLGLSHQRVQQLVRR
ncbi:MAG TPA: type II toxin-antitoxin system HicB family antitoxin [Gaiellaceae bacterium]|nr:type II toxin-antitoxin system HicB family antitoxin [Gaiellaceae bacterium]